MYFKYFAIVSFIATSFVFTACSNRSTMIPKETNILGVIKHEPQSYAHTGPNTFALHTSELYGRENISGDKTTLLWGLITIKDY